MSAMERRHEGQMQKVTVTEGQVLGEASQECSRHDQLRLGVVRSQIKERTPASCSSPGVARPSPRQEETGSRSWAQWQYPWSWLLLRWLGMDLGMGHWEPQAGHVRTLCGRDVSVDRTTPGRLQTADSPSSRWGTRCLYFLILIPIVQFILNTLLSGFCLWLYQSRSLVNRLPVIYMQLNPVSSLRLQITFFGHAIPWGILVPWPKTEPTPLALKAWNPNHWTTRELPLKLLLDTLPCPWSIFFCWLLEQYCSIEF